MKTISLTYLLILADQSHALPSGYVKNRSTDSIHFWRLDMGQMVLGAGQFQGLS